MRKRSTIDVDYVRDTVNSVLRNSGNNCPKERRQGMMNILEDILHNVPCFWKLLSTWNMHMMMTTEMIDRLIKIAQSKAWDDDEDFLVDDYAGGNIDDAFSGGWDAGKISMARCVLIAIGVDWVSK